MVFVRTIKQYSPMIFLSLAWLSSTQFFFVITIHNHGLLPLVHSSELAVPAVVCSYLPEFTVNLVIILFGSFFHTSSPCCLPLVQRNHILLTPRLGCKWVPIGVFEFIILVHFLFQTNYVAFHSNSFYQVLGRPTPRLTDDQCESTFNFLWQPCG